MTDAQVAELSRKVKSIMVGGGVVWVYPTGYDSPLRIQGMSYNPEGSKREVWVKMAGRGWSTLTESQLDALAEQVA